MSSKNKKGEHLSKGAQASKAAQASKGVQASPDSITLKPIFGIRPGVYLTVLYAAVFMLILFFLLVFPGLRNRYGRIRFSSEPWGAAVRMDDVYIGTTPFTYDVPKGARRFTFVLPGFDEKVLDVDVKGRIFASLLFPQKMDIHETIEISDPVNAFTLGAASFSAWSFAGESTSVYQHPMDLSSAAYRVGFVNNPQDRTMIQEILEASARFASTKTAARDLIRAKFIADNAGKAVSPLSALTSIKDIAQYLSDAEGASFWLGAIAPEEAVPAIVDSAWYAEESEYHFSPVFGAYDNSVMNVKNLVFRKIPAKNAFMYNEKFDEDFWICETPVTQSDWDAFVRENPKWSADNIDALISEGLVTDTYLMGINDSRYPRPVVPGISWFAAKAYCDWLSASINTASNYVVQTTTEIRLPTEMEWEYAAAYSSNAASEYGETVMRMIGSFWEWCEDPFVPLNNLPASREAIGALSSPKRSVKGGGSWIGSGVSGGIRARGSLEPNSSSPFVSFRPVIAINNGTAR